MVKKWKIIFSTCLAIVICFTTASAFASATVSPFTKSSFDKSSATGFADAKASAMETMKTGIEEPGVVFPVTIQKPYFSGISRDLTLPEITHPEFNPHPIPTFQVPDWTRGYLPSPQNISIITIIPRDKAIEIALAQFPGGNLGVIGVTYKRINAPAYPLAVNPCWVVEVIGHNTDTSTWPPPFVNYGGQVIIDALTGEVLYVNGWA